MPHNIGQVVEQYQMSPTKCLSRREARATLNENRTMKTIDGKLSQRFKDYGSLVLAWASGECANGHMPPVREGSGMFGSGPYPRGRMFFEGGKIYSYGTHFCIAQRVHAALAVFTNSKHFTGNGQNPLRPSPTTNLHIANTLWAFKHMARLGGDDWNVVYCADPTESVWGNREAAMRKVLDKLEDAVKPRIRETTRLKLRMQALAIADEFNAYLAAMRVWADETSVKVLELPELEVLRMHKKLLGE